MSEYVTLMGAERVADAGRNINAAAEQLTRAANIFAEALINHERFLTDLVEDFKRHTVEGNHGG